MAGMVKNHSLARALSDVSLGEFRRQLEYKTTWYGSDLVVADRFYPSSKTCSRCGLVKAKLDLTERIYECRACGLGIDRDLNAAINLATWPPTPPQSVGTAGTRSVAGRGGKVRPPRESYCAVAHPDEASTDTPTRVGVQEVLRMGTRGWGWQTVLFHPHSVPKGD